MKKKLSQLLALALILSLFAACGGGSDPSKAPETEAPAAETQAPETEAPGEPTEEPGAEGISYPLTDENVEFDVFMAMAGFMPLVLEDGEFNSIRGVQTMEEQTGIHLNFTPIDQDAYTEQLNILFFSGEYPDFIGVPDITYPGGIDSLIEDEICIDLAPLLDSCMPDFKSAIYDVDENYAKDITSDTGKITTIYTYEEQSTMGSIIRQDWLDEVGLDVPDTYDDMYEVLTAFKTELNVKYPMLTTYAWSFNNNNFVGGYETSGGAMPNAGNILYHVVDGKVEAGLVSDGYKAYIEMIRQWWAEGLIGDVSVNIMNEANATEYINANEVGYWVGQSDTMSESTKESAGGSFNAQPMEELSVNPGEEFKLYANTGRKSTAGGWAISTQCHDPEMAAKLINWFWTDEGFIACNYGEEGVTFNYVDGEVVFTDVILANENGFNALFNSCKEIIFFDFPFYFSLERKYATLSNQAEIDSQTVWRTNRSSEMYCPSINNLTVEEGEIYAAKIGDIVTYAAENTSKFVTGAKDMSEWDSYVDQLYTLGLEEIIALQQAAYDRYQSR